MQPIESKHGYSYKGREYPRVSTILQHASKPALVPSAVKITAEHIRAIVDGPGDIDWNDVKREYRRQWERKRDDGSTVHETILRVVDSDAITYDDLTDTQHSILDAYYMWARAYAPDYIGHEIHVVSETHDYAGRFDFAALIGGRVTLGDFKTGAGLWNEMALQLAAYANADYMVIRGEELPLPEFNQWALVHLRPRRQAMFTIKPELHEPAWRAFCGLREFARWHPSEWMGETFPAKTITPLQATERPSIEDEWYEQDSGGTPLEVTL